MRRLDLRELLRKIVLHSTKNMPVSDPQFKSRFRSICLKYSGVTAALKS